MAAVADAKTVYAPADNGMDLIEVVYDFSADGGAQGDLDMLTAGENLLLYSVGAVVETSVTSGGSATVAVKIDSSNITGSIAKATAVAGYVMKPQLTLSEGTPNTGTGVFPYFLASGSKFKFTIGTADLTAGKVHLKVLVGTAY